MEVLPLQNQYPYTECFNVTSVAPPSNITVAATTEAAVSVDTSRNDDVKDWQIPTKTTTTIADTKTIVDALIFGGHGKRKTNIIRSRAVTTNTSLIKPTTVSATSKSATLTNTTRTRTGTTATTSKLSTKSIKRSAYSILRSQSITSSSSTSSSVSTSSTTSSTLHSSSNINITNNGISSDILFGNYDIVDYDDISYDDEQHQQHYFNCDNNKYIGTTTAATRATLTMLSIRLLDELRAAKARHLSRAEVSIPCDLTEHIAAEIVRVSEMEPGGLRGCTIYIGFEAEENNPRRIGTLKLDPELVSTFELFLTLRQDKRSGWSSLIPQFMKKLPMMRTITISSYFSLNKHSLYSPNET